MNLTHAREHLLRDLKAQTQVACRDHRLRTAHALVNAGYAIIKDTRVLKGGNVVLDLVITSKGIDYITTIINRRNAHRDRHTNGISTS